MFSITQLMERNNINYYEFEKLISNQKNTELNQKTQIAKTILDKLVEDKKSLYEFFEIFMSPKREFKSLPLNSKVFSWIKKEKIIEILKLNAKICAFISVFPETYSILQHDIYNQKEFLMGMAKTNYEAFIKTQGIPYSPHFNRYICEQKDVDAIRILNKKYLDELKAEALDNNNRYIQHNFTKIAASSCSWLALQQAHATINSATLNN